jgi:hypothetical protein
VGSEPSLRLSIIKHDQGAVQFVFRKTVVKELGIIHGRYCAYLSPDLRELLLKRSSVGEITFSEHANGDVAIVNLLRIEVEGHHLIWERGQAKVLGFEGPDLLIDVSECLKFAEAKQPDITQLPWSEPLPDNGCDGEFAAKLDEHKHTSKSLGGKKSATKPAPAAHVAGEALKPDPSYKFREWDEVRTVRETSPLDGPSVILKAGLRGSVKSVDEFGFPTVAFGRTKVYKMNKVDLALAHIRGQK